MEKWAIPLLKPKVHHSICQLLYYYYIHLFTKETHSDGDGDGDCGGGAASLGSVWGGFNMQITLQLYLHFENNLIPFHEFVKIPVYGKLNCTLCN